MGGFLRVPGCCSANIPNHQPLIGARGGVGPAPPLPPLGARAVDVAHLLLALLQLQHLCIDLADGALNLGLCVWIGEGGTAVCGCVCCVGAVLGLPWALHLPPQTPC